MTYDPNFTGMNKCDVRILYRQNGQIWRSLVKSGEGDLHWSL